MHYIFVQNELILKLLLPFVAVAFIGIYFVFHTLYLQIKKHGFPHFQSYIGSVLYILIFFYMSIATTCLSYLHCHDVAGISLNFDNPEVICSSTDYKKFSVLVYFIFLIYTVFFPIGTFAFLLWGWKKRKLQDIAFSKHYGALFKTYKLHYFWWEDVVLLRRIVLVTVYVFVSNTTHKQVKKMKEKKK